MSNNESADDPLDLSRKLWGKMGFSLPGMVIPTLDVDELEKRLTDLKAVEGWLKMNLSMLQMTIQGIEMQTTTLKTVREMGQIKPEQASISPAPVKAEDSATDTLQSAMWPWALMQQIQTRMQEASEKPASAANAGEMPAKKPGKKAP